MVFPMSPGRCNECGALRTEAHLADCRAVKPQPGCGPDIPCDARGWNHWIGCGVCDLESTGDGFTCPTRPDIRHSARLLTTKETP